MTWHLNILKILHCYWGTDPLPYLRYKTVESFIDLNPEWSVILYRPAYPSKVVTWQTKELNYEVRWDDHLQDLLDLPIKVKYVDMRDFGMSNHISEVHKSDFLRLWLLGTYGGVWTDMDILYFNPITHLSVNTLENFDAETFVCMSHYGHSNGFFMASPGSYFFTKMAEYSKQDLKTDNFQSNGPGSCNKHFPRITDIPKAVNISMEAVYAHDGQHIPELYDGTKPRFTFGSIGCHWYGGHPLSGEFLRATNGGKTNLPNNIIGNLLK